jgi:LysM repeat protein
VASAKALSGQRIPAVTLSLPVIFGLALLLLVVGAGAVFAAMRGLGDKAAAISPLSATITPTHTVTVTVTTTPTSTSTATPEATWTLPPPVDYKVAAGDTCGGIAYAFGVSVNSIVILNGLAADCTDLREGQVLKIPQPTPTASPQPTSTLNPTEQVQSECNKVDYTVKAGDTLGSIAANYAVSQASIRTYNNKNSDTVLEGEKLIIPLCEQSVETPTPTPVPPYASPNLLLPADGASYISPTDVITLQWSSVGTLRQNEAYSVTIEDVTEGNARKLVNYVTDQKYIVPESFRPTSNTPHVFRWSVIPVRQTGTDKSSGNPIWEPAGTVSVLRVFSWVGTGAPAPTATETPKP